MSTTTTPTPEVQAAQLTPEQQQAQHERHAEPAKGTRESRKELADANRLDEKIRKTARITETNMVSLAKLIAEAKVSGIHKVLGFATWKAYVADVAAKDMPLMHAVSRNTLIKFLIDEGLTQREVVQATGSSLGTVNRVANGSDTGEGVAKETVSKGPQARTASLTDRVAKALESVRAKVGDADNISYADLKRLQKELQHTLSDVTEQLQVRAGRHPSGSQGTNARTGQVSEAQTSEKTHAA